MNFLLGESREVRISIVSTRGDTFNILSASWELRYITTGEVESTGAASIDGQDIYQLITPQKTGVYKLVFTYQIANETLKAVVDLGVS